MQPFNATTLMNLPSPFTYALMALNVAVSLWGFKAINKGTDYRRHLFIPNEVAKGRNLIGLVLSNFSHADLWHLIFNMLTLYFFGPVVEQFLGPHILTIYGLAGMVALLLVFILRKNNPAYRVLGSSGSITGILFAAIVLKPEMSVYFMLIPIPLPAPLFAVIYILFSTYFLDREVGNVAHEAHIGGAITGFVLAGLLAPFGFTEILARIHRLLP